MKTFKQHGEGSLEGNLEQKIQKLFQGLFLSILDPAARSCSSSNPFFCKGLCRVFPIVKSMILHRAILFNNVLSKLNK